MFTQTACYFCSFLLGYLPELAEIVNHKTINDKDDDQLYYTKVYLDKNLRESLKISLDHNAEIFQNLNGALCKFHLLWQLLILVFLFYYVYFHMFTADVQLHANTTEDWPYVENVATKHRPLILHGNGPSKSTLHNLGNYLAKSWSVKEGCVLCKERKIKINVSKILQITNLYQKLTYLIFLTFLLFQDDKLPSVMIAVFIEQATPFLEEFLQQILDTDYPKSKMHLLLRNNVEYHETEVDEFFQTHFKEFATAKRIKPSDYIAEAEARNIAK